MMKFWKITSIEKFVEFESDEFQMIRNRPKASTMKH